MKQNNEKEFVKYLEKKYGEFWFENDDAIDEGVKKFGIDFRFLCFSAIGKVVSSITEDDIQKAFKNIRNGVKNEPKQ